MARYLVQNYIIGKHGSVPYVRMSWSDGWVFKGWVSKFKWFIVDFGFRKGLVAWEEWLRTKLLNIVLPQCKLDVWLGNG